MTVLILLMVAITFAAGCHIFLTSPLLFFHFGLSFFSPAFNRHSNQLPYFLEKTGYHPSVWPLFVFAVVSGVPNDVACATVCRLHEGPCHMFYQTGADCYVGRFTYHSGGTLGDTSANFFMIGTEYRERRTNDSFCNFIFRFFNVSSLQITCRITWTRFSTSTRATPPRGGATFTA